MMGKVNSFPLSVSHIHREDVIQRKGITVAWLSFFPVEWLPDMPEGVKALPRLHPATWQRVLLAELEKMPDVRLHVLVLRKHFQRSLTFERRGVTFHLIKVPPFSRAPSFFWLDTLLVRRVLRRIRPDLVHAWGTENGAALVASRLGYPFLVTMQGLITWLGEQFPLGFYFRFTSMLERLSLMRARVVSAESNFAVRYLKGKFPHLDVRRVEHAPHPVFTNVVRRPQTAPPRFIFLSSLNYPKGGDVFIRALDVLCGKMDFEATIIGSVDEALKRSLMEKTNPELWRRITWKHNLTSEQIADELAAAALMIYTTRGDNSPNSVKEAVVAGVPVVAADIGGISDHVIPGLNGFLFPCGDVRCCAEMVQAACQHPLFGKGLVDTPTLNEIRQNLSTEQMGRAFFETYVQVSGQRR